jgi:DNA-binding XRE family transcriptional regulator
MPGDDRASPNIDQKKRADTTLTGDHARHSVGRVPADPTDDQWIDDESQRIGRRIREVREHHNLTQEAVVLGVPMNRRYYQQIEAGQANPSLRTLLRIARAIGVPVGELLR